MPAWIAAEVQYNSDRVAAMLNCERIPRVEAVATIDWRSLCELQDGAPTIKIDWTLLEFVLLADFLHAGGLPDLETFGSFDDVLGGVTLNKYSASETVFVGEMQRILCWKAIQRDNRVAAVFFYNRFMDYCAGNQRVITAYLDVIKGAEGAGAGAMSFLVGHEFGHFCRKNPDLLTEQCRQLVLASETLLSDIPDEYVSFVSLGKAGLSEFRPVIAEPLLLEEVLCDWLGAIYSWGLQSLQPDQAPSFQWLLDYAKAVHVMCWITSLECALFAPEEGSSELEFEQIALLNSVRSYFLPNHLLFASIPIAAALGEEVGSELAAITKEAHAFTAWLDRTLALLLEKAIFWRFELQDLGTSSLWLAGQSDTMIDHLRRYPNFTDGDYEAAHRIAATLPRGWTVSED